MSNIPVLVYGTLRNGSHNYPFYLKGATTSEVDVRLSGLRMYAGPGYPYVTAGDADDEVTLTLMEISPEKYEETMEGLDSLEGFRGLGNATNHYDRRLVSFSMDDAIVEAYIYVVPPAKTATISGKYSMVEHGDWLKFEREYAPVNSTRYRSIFGTVED